MNIIYECQCLIPQHTKGEAINKNDEIKPTGSGHPGTARDAVRSMTQETAGETVKDAVLDRDAARDATRDGGHTHHTGPTHPSPIPQQNGEARKMTH